METPMADHDPQSNGYGPIGATERPHVDRTATHIGSQIGRADEPLRVFAFGAGGLDATIQLGTVHALLVTGEKADVVLGISAGAVSAVALAEVLKTAPEGAVTLWERSSAAVEQTNNEHLARARDAAAVGRFLEVLEAYREIPMELLRTIQPDLYEVTTGKAISPLELPIHFKEERQDRSESLREKHGLIAFLNGALDCRVRVSTAARLVRLAFDFVAAGDTLEDQPRRRKQLWSRVRLWWEAVLASVTLSSTVGRGLCALIGFGGSRSPGVGVQAKTVMFRRWHALKRTLKHSAEWLIGLTAILTAPLSWCVLAGVDWLERKVVHKDPTPRTTLRGRLLAFFSLDRFLDFFSLKAELGDSYALKQAFVRLFDPDYYGRFSMDEAISTALSQNRNRPQNPPKDDVTVRPKKLSDFEDDVTVRPKKLSDFAQAGKDRFPIHVVPVAANLQSRKLEPLPAETPVVDALMAATALVPVFRAQTVDGKVYCDGANIANEPIRESMRFLQEKANERRILKDISEIIVFSVTPFPIEGNCSTPEKGTEPPAYTQLVDIALRAADLARLRDAKLEQQLMKLYNRALPPDKHVWYDDVERTHYVRANPVPIQIDNPIGLNERVFAARSPQERRRLIATAVADGCRCSLETFIAKDPKFASQIKPARDSEGAKEQTVDCARVIKSLRGANDLPLDLPGADRDWGPGVPEICRACRGQRCNGHVQLRISKPKREQESAAQAPVTHDQNAGSTPLQDVTPTESGAEVAADKNVAGAPQVALLFGGGVFRGVFQIGVANALHMLLQKPPDIVAGASVGSITASLIAQLFCEDDGNGEKQIRRLAATYLSLDRFILTDRFADFVRRFAIRASNADFSVRDLDLLLRRFEIDDPLKFSNRARRVAAGLERLFYLSPFALSALVRALRLQQRDRVWREIQDAIKAMLERYGVGVEALGSEPLTRLLREHVLRRRKVPGSPDMTYADMPGIASFDFFKEFGIELLATVTNLTGRELRVLRSSCEEKPRLVDGLLASSAFPAVFRPRWSWEVFLTPSKPEQFIDGGVFDNLPFHPVVDFIKRRPDAGVMPSRVPHFIFTASLESQPEEWKDWSPEAMKAAATSWPTIRRRATKMKFNKKIDDFARTQREVRTILQGRLKNGEAVDSRLLEIEVLAVKPNWLPGTFAFHPMLGFRRETQAASIAHGCYQTLQALHEFLYKFGDETQRTNAQREQITAALTAWGFNAKFLDGITAKATETKEAANEGQCWYHRDIKCPFSQRRGKDLGENADFSSSLNRIYELCLQEHTHRQR
jgi:predicted acylesterase/phospholipase RssA